MAELAVLVVENDQPDERMLVIGDPILGDCKAWRGDRRGENANEASNAQSE